MGQVTDSSPRSVSLRATLSLPNVFQFQHRLGGTAVGDTMDVAAWIAQPEEVSSRGFPGHRLRNPFAHWIHRPPFAPLAAWVSEVVDEITADPGQPRLGRSS